jgi:hypothetical protein
MRVSLPNFPGKKLFNIPGDMGEDGKGEKGAGQEKD